MPEASHCVFGSWAGRAISSPGVGGISIFHRRWVVCVCVCVCVFKDSGGENTVETQVGITIFHRRWVCVFVFSNVCVYSNCVCVFKGLGGR